VDRERRRVIDLLPDQEADSLAAWRRDHPGVEIVSRDRGKIVTLSTFGMRLRTRWAAAATTPRRCIRSCSHSDSATRFARCSGTSHDGRCPGERRAEVVWPPVP
jgi:hypothetical protein